MNQQYMSTFTDHEFIPRDYFSNKYANFLYVCAPLVSSNAYVQYLIEVLLTMAQVGIKV